MPTDREQLLEFGFPEHLVTAALKATGNSGLQAALDWIDGNPDYIPDDLDDKGKDFMDKDSKDQPAASESPAEPPEGFKKALKCSACDKIFASVELAQLHATKTGHDDFSEAIVKQLTDVEKAAKLEQLKERLGEKRASEATAEREREVKNERIRRQMGREGEVAKRERELEQMDKLRQKQLKEKEDAKREKERVLAMIEEDKRERARKFSKSTSPEETADVEDAEPLRLPTPTDTARIRVKFWGGSPLVYTLKSTTALRELAERIAKDRCIPNVHALVMVPDNRLLGAEQFDSTLAELGLSPSATLMLK